MGRAEKKNKKRWLLFLSHLKDETKYWIYSVFSFIGAAFFLLAYWDKAGVLGLTAKALFTEFFGIGYFLFPLFLISFGIALLGERRPSFLATKILGGLLFIISGLSLLTMIKDESGGIVGNYVSYPFVALFDAVAAKIILGGLLLTSLLIFFDATPKKLFSAALSVFRRRNEGETEESVNVSSSVPPSKTEPPPDTQDKENDDEKQNAEIADADAVSPITQKIKKVGSMFRFDSRTKDSAREESPRAHAYLKSKTYTPPPLSLLEEDKGKPGVGDIKANANIIKRTLENFGISVLMDEVSIGPSFTRYALKPAQGIKLSRIVALQNDLSLALAAHPLRIEAPIPGKSLVGIEIPNSKKTTVGLGSLLATPEMASVAAPLAFPIGRNISGEAVVGNLNKMPHLLIAGATGSGKSVTIHTIITSLLYRNSPAHLRFILIDPKRVELTLYNNIPHLLTQVITEPKSAILALKWAAKEMDRRYDIFETEAVRDIASYHQNVVEPANRSDRTGENVSLPELLPYIVIVIDELADIMSRFPRELEAAIVRLAQMSRAVGIHFVLSTQRPQVNIITGLIKANIPARIALQVSSQTDSRTILDMGGAEKLLGAGDMLFLSGDMGKPVRLQSAYIGEPEIKKVVQFLSKESAGEEFEIDFASPDSKNISLDASLEEDDFSDDDDDGLYEQAREIVIESQKASTTFLQRKLKIGYARAARIMDILEERGVVGPGEGAKPREVLIPQGDYKTESTENVRHETETLDEEDYHRDRI